MMKRLAKSQRDQIDQGALKKIKVEEEKISLNFLVLEQCVSLMKQQKFTDDLSLESANKQFASLLRSNHRKLKVSVKICCQSSEYIHIGQTCSFELNLSHHQHWEDDRIMKNMPKSQLKSIFEKIFIRFNRFHCLSFEKDHYCMDMDGPEILSQVITENQCRPIEVKQLKMVSIDQNISSLIKNLSTAVKEIGIHDGYPGSDDSALDFCTAISSCTNLRSLVFTGKVKDDEIPPLRDCVKLLKHLKHFQLFDSDDKIDSEWLVTAFEDNTNLHSLSLYNHDNYESFDLAQLCVPSMRSIMLRLRYLEISGGFIPFDHVSSWTGFNKKLKQKLQQILSSIHENGRMKVICQIYSGYRDITDMFIDIFRTYLEISNDTARQIDLCVQRYSYESHKVHLERSRQVIDEMLKKEEYKGMIVDQSNGQTVLHFENAKLVLEMNAF